MSARDGGPGARQPARQGSTATRGQRVRPEDIYRWGPVWARQVGRFLDHVWWNTTVHGAEKVPATGPVIIASNHVGIVDGPVVFGALPRGSHFLTKQEFFDSRIGFLMTWAGQIPVDRSSGRAALAVGKALLAEGRVVGIFPEGTRGRGDVSSVRAGVAWLAVNSGAPVVPAACLGTRLPGDSRGKVPRPRSRLHVVFGDPIALDLAPGTSRRDRMAQAMARIGAGLAAHVDHATALTGVPLPDSAEDPGRPDDPGRGTPSAGDDSPASGPDGPTPPGSDGAVPPGPHGPTVPGADGRPASGPAGPSPDTGEWRP
ncbi:1-acyl-sn-glycerol-3-phosphate acyltransferase [Georgenia sp. TF02-10]|uniref:lysophospholipid acyltransferase family protein n=1 Tax=Georgenia sp. TF02-10 TaxID=2917725 RepID=UPI001FA70CC1|nr:lysophospholipid acyltransferase family protein [Georgenia sp. TF02-10]UNX56214.1 1-acyl-sn-glycerol-3-phosphate acyltransferase [Georgenia sp. TF02-10]